MNSVKNTEKQNLNSVNIDSMNIDEILMTINNEDEKVSKAVQEAIPQIKIFILVDFLHTFGFMKFDLYKIKTQNLGEGGFRPHPHPSLGGVKASVG